MFFKLIPTITAQFEAIAHIEMAHEVTSLRATIASYDARIAYYEEDIAKCDRESKAMAKELQALREGVADLVIETAKLLGKRDKYNHILAKYEKGTNECLDSMDVAKNSFRNAYDSLDESQRARLQEDKTRLSEIRDAIAKRKQLIEETGYADRAFDEQRLQHQLNMANARIAELRAKQSDAREPSSLKKADKPHQNDHDASGSHHSSKSGSSARPKRSSRK